MRRTSAHWRTAVHAAAVLLCAAGLARAVSSAGGPKTAAQKMADMKAMDAKSMDMSAVDMRATETAAIAPIVIGTPTRIEVRPQSIRFTTPRQYMTVVVPGF